MAGSQFQPCIYPTDRSHMTDTVKHVTYMEQQDMPFVPEAAALELTQQPAHLALAALLLVTQI